MASLTQTAIISRKAIRYGVYAITFLIIARLTIKATIAIYRLIFPAPPPKPTLLFGKLTEIPFPEKDTPSNLSFILETPEGKLPELPDQIEVFYMPPIASDIQALEKAKIKAKSLGFNPNGKPVIENVQSVYLFNKSNSPATLTMNIISGIFSINYDISSNPSVIDRIPPAPEAAITKAQSYLKKAHLLAEDLQEESSATTEFLRIEGGKFVPAISLSESDLIKVNLFRKALGKKKNIPSVTPDMPEANVWFLYSGFGGGQLIAAEYHYFQVDLKKPATYPLKTSEIAWEELKAGRAWIANLGDNEGRRITVRRVYLAYYDAGLYTEFYQPVVVFEGDNDFLAYVPAVTSDYYGDSDNTSE
jgi:hypothetical protein